jgi:hypothetical protein
MVEKMLDMAEVTSRDYVVDLGSGDGRTVIAAAKRGARALGIEYNPDLVGLSRGNAAAEGVGHLTQFVQGDVFESDFSRATVVTLFMGPSINLKLRPRILELRPGTRVVSNTFRMGDWEPDETAKLSERCRGFCTALPGEQSSSLSDGRLRGNAISFRVADAQYTGDVNGDSIEGTLESRAGRGRWAAARISH